MGKVGAAGGPWAGLSALVAGAGLLVFCAPGACGGGSCCPPPPPASGPRWLPTPGGSLPQGPRSGAPATPPPLAGRPLFAVAPGDRPLSLERVRDPGAAAPPRSGRRRRSGADRETADPAEGWGRSPRGVLRDGGQPEPQTPERDPDKATRFRMEELKLTSTTFALTGDSAHNQAMVHWSGHNSSEDVWDTLFAFTLLANDPRVTVWTTCTVFQESANKKHAVRQPPNHVVPWSQWIDASSHLPVTRAAGLLRLKIVVIILLLQGLWAVWLQVKGLLLIHHFQHALLGFNASASCVIICHSPHALLVQIIKEERGYFRPGCHSASALSAALCILTCILLNCWRNSDLGSCGLCHWAPRATLLTVCPQGTCV